ncbi:IS110 family transposase [bacterium]|nr:IS110 family transposase [bacterium]
MEKIFTGIDISKDWLDFVVCSDQHQVLLGPERVTNDAKGISKLIAKSSALAQSNWFCFEHTGSYGLVLCSLLQARDCDFSVVPALEIIQSQGMTRGKSDKIDAQRIAQGAQRIYILRSFSGGEEGLLGQSG